MDIWTMKIECVHGWYLEEESGKQCELQSSCNLSDLCDFILESFEFDNDHMHDFFISRRPVGSNRTVTQDDFVTLNTVFPVLKIHHLFMHFDFGDDWVFKITRSRKKAEFASQRLYPRIIEHIGKNHEQYPMCEE
jgi:hypothetical protein